MHDRLGDRVMLCDPSEGQIPAHDRLEQMANNLVPDDQPMRRDPERAIHASHWSKAMVSRRFD